MNDIEYEQNIAPEQEKGIDDYLAVLRRRKWQLVVPAVILFLLAAAVAFLLPSVYRSSATILIEQQEIPIDLIRSTVTSYADQRIQVISQRVMTTSNLSEIIEKYDLYPSERRREALSTVIDEMREDISMEMLSADIVDPRSGRPTSATIAFTLSYDNESPVLAQKVANEIVSLYLQENLKTRAEAARNTSSFLADESLKLGGQVAELEARMAEFKEQHVNNLPELVQLNLQMMDRVERQLADTEQQINSLEERRIYLQSELAQIQPNSSLFSSDGQRIQSPEDRLKDLEAEYLKVVASYSERHPDRIRMKREIEALKREVGGVDQLADLQDQLKAQQAELATLLKRYSEQHPDVRKLERNIANTERAIADAASAMRKKSTRPPVAKPDNPAYIQLQAQLQAAESELRSLKTRREEQKAKLDDYEQRLTETPAVEREYKTLARDYENATVQYREIKAKQMEAELAEVLEKERKGERFALIEPPLLEEEPVKPNRLAILFLGLVLSLGGGIGNVALRESMDNSVHSASDIVSISQAPPLAIIPVIATSQDRHRQSGKRLLIVIALIAGVAIVAAAIHFLYLPLDVLWFKALRKLDLLAMM